MLQVYAIYNFIGNIEVCTIVWHLFIIRFIETDSCYSVTIFYQSWVSFVFCCMSLINFVAGHRLKFPISDGNFCLVECHFYKIQMLLTNL